MNINEWFSNHYDPLKNNVYIYTCIYDQGFPVSWWKQLYEKDVE